MKRLWDISAETAFYFLLAFLLLVHFSMAACSLLEGVLLLQLFISLWVWKRWPRLPAFYLFFLIFAALSLVSSLFGMDRLTSLKADKQLFIFLLVPVYLLVLNSPRRRRISLAVVLVAGTLSALVGIGQALVGGLSLAARLKGLTSHWMTFAGLLMMIFVFFALLFILEPQLRLKIFPGLALMLAAILFSLTRSAWLGLAAALVLFLLFYRPRVLAALLPLALILFFLLPAPVKKRVVSITDLQDASNRDRIHMAYTGLRLFRDYPLWGVGPNNVPLAVRSDPRRYLHAQAQEVRFHLHNNFLQILAERGIFALLAFVLAAFFVCRDLLVRSKHAAGLEKHIALAALFTFVAFLVAGLFEYNFGDSEIKFLLFYFLSLPFAGLQGEPDDSTAQN